MHQHLNCLLFLFCLKKTGNSVGNNSINRPTVLNSLQPTAEVAAVLILDNRPHHTLKKSNIMNHDAWIKLQINKSSKTSGKPSEALMKNLTN